MTDLIFPELIHTLSTIVQGFRASVEANPTDRYAWQSLHDRVSTELMMRMMTRIPHDLPVSFVNAQIEPEEQELLEFLADFGGVMKQQCPAHGASFIQQANGKLICTLCGWNN